MNICVNYLPLCGKLLPVIDNFERWLGQGGNEARVEHFLTLPFQKAVLDAFLKQKNLTLLTKTLR